MQAIVRRRPFWLPTLAAIILLQVTIAAGIWQLNRAQTKRDLQAHYDAQEKALPANRG